MATNFKTRKIQLFKMHIHRLPAKEPYVEVFELLGKIKPENRIIERFGRTLAIASVDPIEEGYLLTFLEGEKGISPLLLNEETGEIRTEQLRKNEVLVEKTHALFSPSTRRSAIEYVRRGAKDRDISATIEALIGANHKEFQFSLSPVIDANFLAELTRFERIREAAVRVQEPNPTWSDHYDSLNQLIDDSNGRYGELQVNAKRGKSLKKKKGVVQLIKDSINGQSPHTIDARIVGVR